MRLLLIEDDHDLVRILKRDLNKAGFSVDVAHDGIEGEYMGNECIYELAILDLGLPKRNGIEVLINWRAQKNTLPVLILTARDAWYEKVDGFKAGADDYLAKPFHIEELLARVNVLIHRAHQQPGGTLHIGGLKLDENRQQVITETGETNKLYVSGPRQQPLIIMVYGYTKQNQVITIAVAEDLSPTLARIALFQYRYTVIALVLFAFQVIILRSGFHRLARIQQQIRALEQGEITQLDMDVPQEVAGLVNEVNWLLNVLEQRLQRSRNALGDLAHSLKTPLTVLQQLPREAALKSQPEICHTLQTQTSNMQRMMDRVLKRARMAGSGPAIVKFDMKQEIPVLINILQSMYRDKNLIITFTAPEKGVLLIDREDMLELTGNLLDNACKWAKSRVNLQLDINHAVHLLVEDDGPGVSETNIATLTQRGTRLDEAVSGHGLGLPIAQLIVEQYGGQLNMRRSIDLGGFCVEALLHIAKSM